MTRRNIFVAPYFDDYYQDGGAREQNYHRILFRPGFAVQARELTQSQTILQDQVKRFGDHIFKDGSLVSGGGFHPNNSIEYVKISQFNENDNTIDLESVFNDIEGNVIRGATTGVEAEIVDFYEDGTDKALFIDYTRNGGTSGEVSRFQDDEVLLIEDYAEDFRSIDLNATGTGIRFKIEEGIIYIRGVFISFPEMAVIVDPYDSTADAEVSFEVDENFATSEDDGNLLDNATGSPNFASPGAHRLQIQLSLVSRAIGSADEDEDLFPLLRFEGGVPTHKRDTPIYNELRKEMARQTYDLRGHIAANQFDVTIREHLKTENNGGVFPDGDNQKLVARVSPGRAWVYGFEVENDITRNVVFDKAVETEQIDDTQLTVSLGNYFLVEEVAGDWCQSCVEISIRDTAAAAVTNTTYDSTALPGAEIGTAYFYNLRFDGGTQGTAGAVYQLYLFDINITSGNIKDARSLVLDPGGANQSFADIQLDGDGNANLQDSNLKSLVFRLPEEHVETLRDENGNVTATFEYSDRHEVTFSDNGDGSSSVTIGLTTAGEIFPFGVGALTGPERETIYVSDSNGQVHLVTDAEQTSSTEINITVDSVITDAVVVIRVRRTSAREARKNIRRDRVVKIDVDTHPDDRVFPLGFSDGFELESVIRNTGTFEDTGDDITHWFTYDNGQRDAFYSHAKIRLKEGRVLDGDEKLTVRLAYFEADFSQGLGYYSINSYPVDDSSSDPNFIRTWDIPTYETRDGRRLNLVDSVDFRNQLANTATDTTDLAQASVNPTEDDNFLEPPGGVRNVIPTRPFTTSLRYYLPYYAVISVDKDGEFEVTRSNASENPSAPKAPKKNMILATIRVNEYPSLAPKFARTIGKTEIAVDNRVVTHKIYTDSDVSNLEKRLESLEEEVSLNTLEREANTRRYVDENNIERFKNGFVTDRFQDHSVGAFEEDGYNAAISSKRHQLTPSFELNFVELQVNTEENTN